jgi:hypothetical protein
MPFCITEPYRRLLEASQTVKGFGHNARNAGKRIGISAKVHGLGNEGNIGLPPTHTHDFF